MTDSIRHAGRWTLEQRFASPWHYLPVEVPPGTGGLRVELEYELAGGAVLDLGCLGPGGFRGWSGSARESFVIARDAATPGYLPGELEAGTWQVVIGVHRVPPDGVGYRLSKWVARHKAGGAAVAGFVVVAGIFSWQTYQAGAPGGTRAARMKARPSIAVAAAVTPRPGLRGRGSGP